MTTTNSTSNNLPPEPHPFGIKLTPTPKIVPDAFTPRSHIRGQVERAVNKLIKDQISELQETSTPIPNLHTLEHKVIQKLVAEKEQVFLKNDPKTHKSPEDLVYNRLIDNKLIVNKAISSTIEILKSQQLSKSDFYQEKNKAFDTFIKDAVSEALKHFAEDPSASLTEPRFYSGIAVRGTHISVAVHPSLDSKGNYDLKMFVSIGDIASGSFGTVKTVINLCRDNMGVNAMKITALPDTKGKDVNKNKKAMGQYDSMVRETDYLARTSTQLANTVKTHEIFYTTYPQINLEGEDARATEAVAAQVVIMDYFQFSSILSLDEFILNIRLDGDMPLVVDLYYQMACQVRDIHEKEIAHCDIKPENFLYDTIDHAKDLELGNIKIGLIDGGAATKFADIKEKQMAQGTLAYWAPEQIHNFLVDNGVLKKKPIEITPSIDIWAEGITLYRMQHYEATDTSKMTEEQRQEQNKEDEINAFPPHVQGWIRVLTEVQPAHPEDWHKRPETIKAYISLFYREDPRPPDSEPLEQVFWSARQRNPKLRPSAAEIADQLDKLR